jgi:hypothetical protein
MLSEIYIFYISSSCSSEGIATGKGMVAIRVQYYVLNRQEIT